MNANKIQEKVLKICEELCCKKVDCEEKLMLTGMLDSFQLMELICYLEKEFRIAFQPKELSDLDYFSSVNSIVELVKKRFR